jgi:hypothetical protein
MAHGDKNEHKRNQGKPRLAIPSHPGHAPSLLFQCETPKFASAQRDRLVRPRTIRHPLNDNHKFPRRTSRSTETASPIAHFLIANARLKLIATHSKISPLKIPNREQIAFSNRNFSNRRAPGFARHSSLSTRHFFSNRNSRFTGSHLTTLTPILTQFLTATNSHFCPVEGRNVCCSHCLLFTTRLHHF